MKIKLITLLVLGALLLGQAHAKPQQTQIGEFKTKMIEGSLRGYKIYTPKGYDPDGSWKYEVVFLLHGDICSPDTLAGRLSSFIRKADSNGFILVLPQAMYDLSGDTLSPTTNNLRLFNDDEALDMFLSWSLDSRFKVSHELRYLKALHTEVTANYKADPDRFYLAGHSMGALLTQYAAMELNHEFAAFASIAGPAPRTDRAPQNLDLWKPSFRVPILLMYATKDSQVPFDITAVSNFSNWIETNTKTASDENTLWKLIDSVKETPNNITVSNLKFCNGDVELYLINGGGHHWHRPGGFTLTDDEFIKRYNYNMPSPIPPETLCKDINTTNVVWDFFKNRRKSHNGPIPKS